MDLFGLKEHDARHDQMEKQLRKLVEENAKLRIDHTMTRMELHELHNTVDGKVSEADVDPTVSAMNEAIKKARLALSKASDAAEEQWNKLSEDLAQAIEDLKDKTEDE